MKFNKLHIASLLVILLAFGLGIWAYPFLPDQIASHWNLEGNVDGYMDRFWGVFLFPTIMVGAYLLSLVIPKIDPKAKNIEKFRQYFDGFILVLLSFFLILYKLTLLWNLGYQMPLNVVLPVLMGGLFFYIGVMVSHAEPNWTIGIKTPWTLSDDQIWYKTHKLGGKLFKAAGVVASLSALLPSVSFFFVVGSIAAVSLFLFIYSFYLFKTK